MPAAQKPESKPPSRATLDAAAQAAREAGVRITLRRGDWVIVIDPPRPEITLNGAPDLDMVKW